jgi:hypothetical protein
VRAAAYPVALLGHALSVRRGSASGGNLLLYPQEAVSVSEPL